MKSIFIKRLILIMVISMFLLLIWGYNFVIISRVQNFNNISKEKINQIIQLISKKEKEFQILSNTTDEEYINKARTIAYVIENNPEELINIAKFMQIDEIHIFDEEGIIISSNIPVYIGLGVNDGEQIGYFKQILENPTLELVQELLPATANEELMKYSAVSRKDKKGFVQIGIKSERLLSILDKRDKVQILSNMITDISEVICIINAETGAIEGITSNNTNHLKFYDLENTKKILEVSEPNKYVEISESEYFAVALKSNNRIIFIAKSKDAILVSIERSVIVLAISLLLVSILMIISIKKLLEKHVILGIEQIIFDLRKITDGNMETSIKVDNNPEFEELSHQINTMVGYLLRSTSKISRIIDTLDINMAIYEYSAGFQKVRTTSRLANILGLTSKEEEELFNNKSLFEKRISLVYKGYQDKENKMIHRVHFADGNKYIKIKTFNDVDITMGIVIDVTDDIEQRDCIIKERDYDILSELYNRRAFVRETNILFEDKEELKISCIMMIDMDDLKPINDLYGHHAGDEYIKAGADILRQSQENEKVLISRIGGDEFAMMWYGYDTKAEIVENIERMYRQMIETTIPINNKKQACPVSFSGGYAFYPEHSKIKTVLLKLSDKALYRAKHKNKREFIEYISDI